MKSVFSRQCPHFPHRFVMLEAKRVHRMGIVGNRGMLVFFSFFAFVYFMEERSKILTVWKAKLSVQKQVLDSQLSP